MLSVEEMMAVFISMTLSVAYGLATATVVLYKLATMVAIIIWNKTSAILKPQKNINPNSHGLYKLLDSSETFI